MTTVNRINEICTTTSVLQYYEQLLCISSVTDIIYMNTLLSLDTTFNKEFKQTLIEVFKRKSPHSEHLTDAEVFTKTFNQVNQYWNANGRTNSYYNNFNRIYYNDKQLKNKKAIYPFSFADLVHLYQKYKVYSKVVLMVSEMLPSKIEFSRNVLFGRVIKTVDLGPLKPDMEILLVLGLNDYLNGYSYFIVILASNGVIAYSRPFSLHCRNFESTNNKLILAEIQNFLI
ncbi:hypothetical protein PIROE2DRAFT_18983 [Piromyces sp. E2]|nr:hypothetical protein PIROE2DRAFT_18983 [Piromyces sp. E2]|eukprot:OUM56421.1 hypothetical protein PIROE2DRAFT_18983 [Piromyces sp. E2]